MRVRFPSPDSRDVPRHRWRDRLAEDKPLPGVERVSVAARLIFGADDRPKASCSVAAAVAALLAVGPDPMGAARYGEASWLAHHAAAAGDRDDEAAPVYPGVNWYLPAELADIWHKLRGQAWVTVVQAHRAVRAEAEQRYPADGPGGQVSDVCKLNRHRWYPDQLQARRIPARSGSSVREAPVVRLIRCQNRTASSSWGVVVHS
jgi:hypothetical protein